MSVCRESLWRERLVRAVFFLFTQNTLHCIHQLAFSPTMTFSSIAWKQRNDIIGLSLLNQPVSSSLDECLSFDSAYPFHSSCYRRFEASGVTIVDNDAHLHFTKCLLHSYRISSTSLSPTKSLSLPETSSTTVSPTKHRIQTARTRRTGQKFLSRIQHGAKWWGVRQDFRNDKDEPR